MYLNAQRHMAVLRAQGMFCRRHMVTLGLNGLIADNLNCLLSYISMYIKCCQVLLDDGLECVGDHPDGEQAERCLGGRLALLACSCSRLLPQRVTQLLVVLKQLQQLTQALVTGTSCFNQLYAGIQNGRLGYVVRCNDIPLVTIQIRGPCPSLYYLLYSDITISRCKDTIFKVS